MPVFGALILIILAYFKYMGDGPVYDAIMETTLGEKCRTYWWTSLLFIQNYYNPLNEVNIAIDISTPLAMIILYVLVLVNIYLPLVPNTTSIK